MYLMNRNNIVADVEMKHGIVLKIKRIYDKNALPIGVYPANYEFGRDEEKDADLLDDWRVRTDWGNGRKGIKAIKQGIVFVK